MPTTPLSAAGIWPGRNSIEILEQELDTELHDARIAEARDLTISRRVSRRAEISEISMIENVEGLSA